jgi:ADP-ribose pyrophosphatase
VPPRKILHLFPKLELDLEVVRDRSSDPTGFLTLKRFDLVLRTNNNNEKTEKNETKSPPFPYDVVERHAIDAAVIAAHHIREDDGERCLYLRSAVRPPVALRHTEWNEKVRLTTGQRSLSCVLWELPAGLIEPEEAPDVAAARELEEELGFSLSPKTLQPLGPWAFPAPGFIGEIHFFFHAEVDPKTRKEPDGDGSPLEDAARIISIPLKDALTACRDGIIRDAKTELAIRRLADLFAAE